MTDKHPLEQAIFDVKADDFEDLALEVFRWQVETIPVYGEYLELLKVRPSEVRSIEQIPFLPINFFKTHNVVSPRYRPQRVFRSSGTTGVTSQHHVLTLECYNQSLATGFEHFGDGCLVGMNADGRLRSEHERQANALRITTGQQSGA